MSVGGNNQSINLASRGKPKKEFNPPVVLNTTSRHNLASKPLNEKILDISFGPEEPHETPNARDRAKEPHEINSVKRWSNQFSHTNTASTNISYNTNI